MKGIQRTRNARPGPHGGPASWRARLASLWRNVVYRDRVRRELDDELKATLEILVSEHIRAGLGEEDARRAARLELGSLHAIGEQVWDVRAGASLDWLLADLRFGWRLLVRNPLFTLTATLSLAVGIGASVAIFTVTNGLLLRAAEGVSDPGGLVDIVRTERGEGPGVSAIWYPDFQEIRRRATAVQDVYAWQLILNPATLRVDGGAERVFPNPVSINYFEALGVRPAVGRLFGPGDVEASGASPIVVLSHAFWERRFGRDPAVVGRTIRVNGYPLTVVGVSSAAFRGTSVGAPDLWLPLEMLAALEPDGDRRLTARQDGWLMLGARLRPGMSRARASAEIGAIGAAITRDFPVPREGPPGPPPVSGGVEPYRQDRDLVWSAEAASPIPYGLRVLAAGFLALLMALVLVVLAIACANLSGVLLARATTRRREIAVRMSNGATRARLIRQFLTEALLLFLLGGVSGLVLSRLLTMLLVRLLPAFQVPIALSLPLDGRVIAFALGLSLAAALLSGLAPALHAAKADLVPALKDDAHGTPERLWPRHAFVVAQVACSLLLIITASLLVRALDEVSRVNRGYDPSGVDAVGVRLSMGGHTGADVARFARDLIERVRALPGVRTATLASQVPGQGAMSLGGISVPGVTPPSGLAYYYPSWTIVDTGYFQTLRIPLLDGRDFSAADDARGEPVVILGRRAAGLFWPDERAVGRYVVAHGNLPGQPMLRAVPDAAAGSGGVPAPVPMRVVGVVEDVSAGGPPELYVPLRQRFWSDLTILARRSGTDSVAEALRGVVTSTDPNLPVLFAQSLASLRSGPVETQLRVAAAVSGAVGLIGVLLAGMGIYGVTAYAVARRTREIGIRLSLGAGPGTVMALVLRQAMSLVAAGTGIGVLLGIGAGRVLSGQRFDVPPPDATLLIGAAALFTLVGLAASYVPVRRAVRIHAMDALRSE